MVPPPTTPTALELDLSIDDEGVAWLRLVGSGGEVALGIDEMRSLDIELGRVERAIGEGQVRAMVLAATPEVVLTGYGAAELRGLTEDEVVGWSHEGQGILRRLEELPIPTVAAIEGEWTGGALELALACRHRIAVEGVVAALGMTQLRSGLIPSWGGTVRLPRMIGLEPAARLILTGELVDARAARRVGLVNRVYRTSDFAGRVQRFALRRASGRAATRNGRSLRQRLLHDSAAGRRLALGQARRRYLRGGGGDLAGQLALELLFDGLGMSVERAFARESAIAGQLLVAAGTRGRLHFDRAAEAARRSPVAATEIESAAVLGVGLTSSDFAHLLASAGVPVRLRGVTRAAARDAVARARYRFEWERASGRISDTTAQHRAELIEPTTGWGGFGTADLLVAVAEPDTDAIAALQESETHVRSDCVLAFHHWRLSPTQVQREMRRPERVVGLVPGLPADRFPLLEIVPGATTTANAVAAMRRMAKRLSLTPVVVAEQTPTPASRLLGVYFAEASRLLAEGATVSQVDAAAEDFGFLLGPFHRIDGIGSLRAHELLRDLEAEFGERMRPAPLFTRFAEQAETFYRYRGGVPTGPHPDLPSPLSPGGRAVTDLIRRRLLLLLVNEAVRIVEEGSASPEAVDVISVLGLGFPQERGGILFHAQETGLDALLEELSSAARRSGARYQPPELLASLVREGGGFYAARGAVTSGHGSRSVL